MRKRVNFTVGYLSSLSLYHWMVILSLLLFVTIWMPLGVSNLLHWQGRPFLLHGGIWALTILILYMGMKISGKEPVHVSIRPLPPLVIPLILMLTVFFALGTEPLEFLQPFSLRGTNPHPFDLTPTPVTFILFVMVLPLLEEVFFRGILLGHMLSGWSVTRALVISSLMYSLSQWGNEHLLRALLLGMVSGVLYVITRSLLASIIFHVSWNFFIFFSWLDDVRFMAVVKEDWPVFWGQILPEVMGLVSGIILILFLMRHLMVRQHRTIRGKTERG